ncbi:hypothetical protein [Spirosoma sp. KNUC1025]|uniref:hypothetical protein n=1 Tax=Spirosoma sp. KNUC1025 TaxID=2894082 RepID=UPI00386AD6CD|nr:hypothetical protein LN737_09790 [Spirosoma sp. KNUC1025]
MHIDLYHHKSIPHLNQIFTGFRMLERKGLLTLTVIQNSEQVFADASLPIVRVCVDKRHHLIFDTLDGYRFDHSCSPAENVRLLDRVLGTCHFYFKRSFSKRLNRGLNRTNIHPLGLNYNVYNELYSEFSQVKPFSKAFLRLLVTHNRLLARLSDVEYYNDLKVDNLAALPLIRDSYNYPGSILFLTRPWDPFGQELPQDLIEERHEMNEFRAACIRACRKEFGTYFTGGFSDSAYARSMYPDLIVDKSLTGKANYLGVMRKSAICVATTGLHDSIGWKFGEYVSHAKGIISESLKYTLPGSFSEPDNYLTFRSVDELLRQINSLQQNPDKLIAMMQANHQYYTEWVRPDALIMNTLLRATSTLPV